MSHAAKLAGDVGMSRDERSMLLGNRGESGGDSTKQLLNVLAQIRDIAEAVVDGRAGGLWSDECMNQLILGVELGLAQGWNDVVDAFSDAGRILQSYENGGRADDSTLYLIDAYDLLCGLVTDSMNGSTRADTIEKWRARHQEEVATLEAAGLALVNDDFEEEVDDDSDSPFEMPEVTAKNIVKLRPQDDLPSLDELPPLDTVISGGKGGQKKPLPSQPAAHARPTGPRVAKSPIEVAREAEEARAKAARGAEEALEQAELAAASGKGVEPSQVIVEFVDRICEELAGLSQHSSEERVLSLEMIQGGIAALKREAVKDGYGDSAELCDQMARACLFVSQSVDTIDERFTDLAFGFCGVYVEAMNSETSQNIDEWRAECASLIDAWAESEAASEPAVAEAAEAEPVRPEKREDAPAASGKADNATPTAIAVEPKAATPQSPAAAAAVPAPEAAAVQMAPGAPEASAPQPAPSAPQAAATPSVVSSAPVMVSSAAAPEPPRAAATPPAPTATAGSPALARLAAQGTSSAELFQRAQEALMRGDGESAKVLALQAAAMIAETEVDKAEARLRDAEARLKANVSATEEARSEVKHTEKLVMNAASDVSAGETQLGQSKSFTAKITHELQESQAEVAEIDRQIAELMKLREEQVKDVESKKVRLEEAKGVEHGAESQLETLRDAERESRKSLEAARQRVKDHQRIAADIENEMERARETLSRQRGSFADIMQTINRPEPIKTGENGEDSLLF